jgi:hypothetical protein
VGRRLRTYLGKLGMGFEVRSPLIEAFRGCAVFLCANFQGKVYMTNKGDVYMTRLLIHPLYNFVLVLALCVSVGVAGFLLTHSHFFSAPQAAEVPSASGHTGELPPVW